MFRFEKGERKMSILDEIIDFILKEFDKALAEILQALDDVESN